MAKASRISSAQALLKALPSLRLSRALPVQLQGFTAKMLVELK